MLAFSGTLALNTLGRFGFYPLLAFFWGDEVVVDGRFAEHTQHNTRTHNRGETYRPAIPHNTPTAI